MQLQQLNALILDAEAIYCRPGIWISRDGVCRCGMVDKPPFPSASSWEVEHLPDCPIQQAHRVLMGLKQLRREVLAAASVDEPEMLEEEQGE